MNKPWLRDEFVSRLREVGSRAYHDKHPFHLAMNEGRLSRDAICGWVTNRFYYQQNIPIKDAAILSNCPVREVRRVWIHRILDHDGVAMSNRTSSAGGDTSSYKERPSGAAGSSVPGGKKDALETAHATASAMEATRSYDEGGIEAWLRLGEACGLSRAELLDSRNVLPGVVSAVDAYVNFARTQPWPIAVASSLTELFAPDLMATRLRAFEQFYRWIEQSGLDYFKRRIGQARRDSEEALAITLDYCITREMQDAAMAALEFKCNVLWSMLDAIQLRYGEIGSTESRSAMKGR